MKAVELYVHGFKDWCQNEAKPCKGWKNSGVFGPTIFYVHMIRNVRGIVSSSVFQVNDVLISHVSGKLWLV